MTFYIYFFSKLLNPSQCISITRLISIVSQPIKVVVVVVVVVVAAAAAAAVVVFVLVVAAGAVVVFVVVAVIVTVDDCCCCCCWCHYFWSQNGQNQQTWKKFACFCEPTSEFPIIRGLVFVENNLFGDFVEEVSTIVKIFQRPWFASVIHFCMFENQVSNR